MYTVTKEVDAANVAKAAGEKLNELIKENPSYDILLLLSGGSSFQILDHLNLNIFNSKVSVSVLDERWSAEESINNFLQLKKTQFYMDVKESCDFIETIPNEGETLEDFENRINADFSKWMQSKKYKIIITQGVGKDSHTSGIMPYPEDNSFFQETFVNTDKPFVGYDAKEKNQYRHRLTTTIKFLINKVDIAICYIVGEDKKTALEHTLNPKAELNESPSSVIQKMKEVYIFTDLT